MTPEDVRGYIQSSLAGALADAGFVAEGQLLIRRRCEPAMDCLAVMASPEKNGFIDATVTVGIHCAPLHRLLAELAGKPYSERGGTFGTNIGSLEQSHHFGDWAFNAEDRNLVLLEDLIATVKAVALPFLETFVDLASVRRGCERYGSRELDSLRLPALELLAGNFDEAKRLLDSAMTSAQFTKSPFAESLRAAAEKLAQRIGAGER